MATFSHRLINLQAAGAYLPGIILFYLSRESRSLLVVSVLSLSGAALYHGVVRATFGPGGPQENPLEHGEVLRRYLVQITKKGPQQVFPENHLDIGLNSLSYWSFTSWPRRLFILAYILLFGIWFYSVYLLYQYREVIFWESPFSVALLSLAFVIWVLQYWLWKPLVAVHLVEKNSGLIFGTASPDLPSYLSNPRDQPDWMDEQKEYILAIMAWKDFPVSDFLLLVYSGFVGGLDGVPSPDLEDNEDLRDSLQALMDYGLVSEIDGNLYQITEAGKSYLSGDLELDS